MEGDLVLEAVWFSKGKEVAWVDPVKHVDVDTDAIQVVVDNGYHLYTRGDFVIPDDVDDFIVRIKKTEE
jgi:hypothetical protein